MKKIIKLTESDLTRIVKRVIKEQAQGESEFIQTIVDEYDISDELKNEIINTIKNSECKNVVFEKIAMGDGLSVHNKVIINPITLNYSLGKFLFIIFHELAHQYQFKKYGIEKMLELYNDESDLKEGAEFMMSVEKVADEFASRKLRSLERKGLIELNPSDISTTNKRINLGMLEHMISMFKSQLKRNNIKSPEEISEFLYNMVRIR